MTKLKLFEYITGSQYLWGFKGKWTEEDEKDCFDIASAFREPTGCPCPYYVTDLCFGLSNLNYPTVVHQGRQ